MFQFRRFPPHTYGFSVQYLPMKVGEFPHSEISGSMDVCSSPKLIAAYHVFHRLPVPRHSPCALSSLTVFFCLRLFSLLPWFSICQQENLQNCIFLDNFTNLILFLQNYSVFKVQVSLRSPCTLSYFIRKVQTTRPSLYKDYTSYNRLSPVSRPSHFCVAEIILESYAVYPIILRIIESQLEVFFLLFREDGGPKWTRTIDLSIISRVL